MFYQFPIRVAKARQGVAENFSQPVAKVDQRSSEETVSQFLFLSCQYHVGSWCSTAAKKVAQSQLLNVLLVMLLGSMDGM